MLVLLLLQLLQLELVVPAECRAGPVITGAASSGRSPKTASGELFWVFFCPGGCHLAVVTPVATADPQGPHPAGTPVPAESDSEESADQRPDRTSVRTVRHRRVGRTCPVRTGPVACRIMWSPDMGSALGQLRRLRPRPIRWRARRRQRRARTLPSARATCVRWQGFRPSTTWPGTRSLRCCLARRIMRTSPWRSTWQAASRPA